MAPSSFTPTTNNMQQQQQQQQQQSSGLKEMPDPKTVDALLAKELYEMSKDQREQAFLDLHCLKNGNHNNNNNNNKATMERAAIQQLSQELQMDATTGIHPWHDDPLYRAYAAAHEQNPAFVQDPAFLIQFLRAARFHVGDAKNRLLQYLTTKRNLFGDDKLTLPITLESLDDDDLECLKSGIMQLLPQPDQGGRVIFLWIMMFRHGHSQRSKRRVQFYGIECASHMPEAQQNGLVVVTNNFGPGKMPVEEATQAFRSPALVSMQSVRCDAFHFCLDHDHDQHSNLTAGVMALVGGHTRARFRRHVGTVRELKSSLASFGIPTERLPWKDDGTYQPHNHQQWLAQRRIMEQQLYHGGSSRTTTTTTTTSARIPLNPVAVVPAVAAAAAPAPCSCPSSSLDELDSSSSAGSCEKALTHAAFASFGQKDQSQQHHQLTKKPSFQLSNPVVATNNNMPSMMMMRNHQSLVLSPAFTNTTTAAAAVATASLSSAATTTTCHKRKKASTTTKTTTTGKEPTKTTTTNNNNTNNKKKAKPNHNNASLEKQQQQHSSSSGSSSKFQPPPQMSQGGWNIICGKGKPIQKQPGNIRFNQFLEQHLDEYESSETNVDKTILTCMVLKDIQRLGGCFLKCSSSAAKRHWEPVDDVMAREKIASTFRSIRRKRRQNQRHIT